MILIRQHTLWLLLVLLLLFWLRRALPPRAIRSVCGASDEQHKQTQTIHKAAPSWPSSADLGESAVLPVSGLAPAITITMCYVFFVVLSVSIL